MGIQKITQWRRGHTLGHGSTSTVSIATACNSGEVFAVKSAQLSRSDVLKREESILSSLNSSFIISSLGSDISRDPVYQNHRCYNLFLEYAPGGSLYDEIKNHEGKLTESYIRSRTYEILSGLDYIHENGVVHCDIKCENILIGCDGCAKIADFGCAKREFGEDEGLICIKGTPRFMAPEVVRGEEQGAPSDVWALGCVIIQMATGGVPWPGFSSPVSVMHHIGYSCDVPMFPDWISDQGKDFLSKCLNRDVNERWSVAKLLKHPFVTEKGEIETWVSPKSILDQEIWETLTLEITEPLERIGWIGLLAIGQVSSPDWSSDGENWIMVRGESENGFVCEEATTPGDHMETEGLGLDTDGLDFDFRNNDSLEGAGCNNRDLFLCCSFDDLLKRNKELNERFLIGYICLVQLAVYFLPIFNFWDKCSLIFWSMYFISIFILFSNYVI